MRTGALLAAIVTLGFTIGNAQATVVSGRVTASNGSGIADVDLDFIDRNSGQSITLVNDNTDFLGFYAVTVPAGDYDVRFEPLPGDRYVGFEERGFRAEGASANLDVTLDDGWFLSGRVIDDGFAPVMFLDLDFVDSVDGPIFIANDNTDALGNFSVVVPTATLSMQLQPDLGSPLVAREIDNLAIGGDTALGDVVLVHGFHLTGSVFDQDVMPGPGPISGVRVETVDPVTGVEIYNIRNNTDALGGFDLVVAPGPVNLQFIPPRGSKSLPRFVAGIDMQADTALPTIALEDGVLAGGLVLAPGAVPAEGTDLDFLESVTGFERWTPRDNADEFGEYDIAVRPGSYQVGFAPTAASGLAPAQLDSVNLSNDATLPTIQLQPGRTVSGVVKNGAGLPLPGVDLDFNVAGGGIEILTSQDRTDATGAFSVIVPSGTYDIEFSPVNGSNVGQLTLFSTVVAGNVNLGTVTLPAATAASTAGLSPSSGSALGGTLVTVTGGGFAPGVKVNVGGSTLTGVVIVNATTLQGTTRLHPAGTVDVAVTNPGTQPVAVPGTFTYTVPAIDPVLTLQRTGPLDTDVLLQWSDTGRGTYVVYRSPDAAASAMGGSALDAVLGTSYRDDGAGDVSAGSLLFYVVY